jgi:hypothetical protein
VGFVFWANGVVWWLDLNWVWFKFRENFGLFSNFRFLRSR